MVTCCEEDNNSRDVKFLEKTLISSNEDSEVSHPWEDDPSDLKLVGNEKELLDNEPIVNINIGDNQSLNEDLPEKPIQALEEESDNENFLGFPEPNQQPARKPARPRIVRTGNPGRPRKEALKH